MELGPQILPQDYQTEEKEFIHMKIIYIIFISSTYLKPYWENFSHNWGCEIWGIGKGRNRNRYTRTERLKESVYAHKRNIHKILSVILPL